MRQFSLYVLQLTNHPTEAR